MKSYRERRSLCNSEILKKRKEKRLTLYFKRSITRKREKEKASLYVKIFVRKGREKTLNHRLHIIFDIMLI